MSDYEDYHEPRRAPGSRFSVFLVGLLIGGAVMTAVWVALAGNPLSDTNEVIYENITIANVNLEKNTMCWSEDPSRRDAGQRCAILSLDRSQEPPMPGTRVTVGTVELEPPDEDVTRQAVYVSSARRQRSSEAATEPTATPSD